MYKVYKNLHNGKWSIMDVFTGLVCGHADSIAMMDATTKVSQAGRARVIMEGKKNVHAFIVGSIVSMNGFTPYRGRSVDVTDCEVDHIIVDRLVPVTYNPYRYTDFVIRSSEQIVPRKIKVVFLNHTVTMGF